MTVLKGGDFGKAAGNRCIFVAEQSRSSRLQGGKAPTTGTYRAVSSFCTIIVGRRV
jgi:hypothetical protein